MQISSGWPDASNILSKQTPWQLLTPSELRSYYFSLEN